MLNRTLDSVTESLTKFAPVMVSSNPELPASIDLGLRLEIEGTSVLTGGNLKIWGSDAPPPGEGLNTVTRAAPAEAMSFAGMSAFSCSRLTKVVFRSSPFQRTFEVETKLEPLTVRVKAGPPAFTLRGLRLEIDGTDWSCRCAGDCDGNGVRVARPGGIQSADEKGVGLPGGEVGEVFVVGVVGVAVGITVTEDLVRGSACRGGPAELDAGEAASRAQGCDAG